jgi:hypothetical protein
MRNGKRILSVKVIREVDTDPDTSYLGEYANRPDSEYSIDRAHSEDCAAQIGNPQTERAKQTLEHVQQTIGDMQNSLRGYGMSNTESAEKDAEWDALEDAYNEVGELLDAVSECDCGKRGDMERNQYRYFNPSLNYIDKYGRALPENTPDEVRKYVRQDYERMENLNKGLWSFLGIRAEARTWNPETQVTQRISSGGLWGIESDGDSFEDVEQEQLSELKTELKALGFSTRAISKAFQNVEREEN